ncbi:MAG: FG-GAP repeat domain-containing protein, partial [Candidatus Baldrarchaeia archaeon]
MLRERKLFVLSILFLLTLSLASMPLTVALTTSDVQAKSINETTDTFPSQMKIIREADVYQTSSEILYIWNWQHQDLYGVNKWIVIIYSEEYNETAGKYYYALTEAESIGGGTIGHITTTEWNVVWQKCLDMPIVWGRIADIDGDNLPEIITIPDVENLTIVYDDDGTQLTKFAIPDYRRALAVTDWTGDGIDDIILITGSYYDLLLGKHYLDVEVFDIYQNQTSTSSIYLPDDLVVGEAFVGDWQLSLQGMEIAVLETSLYYGDSHSMAILSASNTSATMINLPYKNTFRSDIALSENYLAFSFEDESTDKYGVAVLFNGSILWYYQTSYDIDGLEIAELDGDSKPELIVMTDWEVKIFDIEKTPPKATIPASRALALPLDFDFDGISEVILFQEYGIAWIREPFSEWFYVIYWRCPSSCVLINSTTLEEISDVVLEDSRAIFLPPRDIDDDSLLEFFGVSTSSSETLSVYSIMEVVPPVVDIVSPVDGSWIGDFVWIDISASDE